VVDPQLKVRLYPHTVLSMYLWGYNDLVFIIPTS
jgi:hypothetical protein